MTSDAQEKDTMESVNEMVNDLATKLEPVIKPIAAFVSFMLPILIKYVNKLHGLWKKMPKDEASVVVGLVFCFFGGFYPTLFAAIQAAKACGWDSMCSSLAVLANEVNVIIEEDKKDSLKDDDGDGVADVDQMSNKEFVMRKTKLVITKVNPKKVDVALGDLYTVWLGVAAALAVKFARTISLSLALAENISKPALRFGVPLLTEIVPKEYSKWIPVLINWFVKSIAMSIAWTIQTVISAFTSAVQGGLIAARAILKIANKHGSDLFGFIPKDDTESYIDEIIGYGLAVLGFYFQFQMGFDIQFPLNIPLMPFEITEMWLRWYITD